MNGTQQRLKELEWGLARLTHPRRAQRSPRYFGVACSTDGGRTFANAYPVDISVDGVALISPEELKTRRFIVTLEIDSKRIQATAQCVTMQKGTLRGNVVWRIGARFIQIAREDRQIIDRFVRRIPLNAATAAPTLGALPGNVVRAILDELIATGRLSRPRHGMQPLVKMTYSGLIQRGTQVLHGVKIESRVVRENTCTVYHTQAYVSERLTKIEVIPLDNGLPEAILPTAARPGARRRRLPRLV